MIHEKDVSCPRCGGSGKLTRVDGADMRRRREAKGIGLSRFARSIGKTPAFISDIELGKRNPSPETLKDIQKALK